MIKSNINHGWRFLVISLGTAIGALLGIGHALTFAWLSSFPERSLQLEELNQKFWIYTATSLFLFIVSAYFGFRFIKFLQNSKSERV